MIQINKNLILVFILIALVCLGIFRWENGPITSRFDLNVQYKIDRWVDQPWIVVHGIENNKTLYTWNEIASEHTTDFKEGFKADQKNAWFIRNLLTWIWLGSIGVTILLLSIKIKKRSN